MKKLQVFLSAITTLLLCIFLIGCVEKEKIVELNSPVLTLENRTVLWESIYGASRYEVYVNGTSVGIVTETSYTLETKKLGEYKITVKALTSDSNKFLNSKVSEEKKITIKPVQLSSPITTIKNKVVIWNLVNHAVGYEVYLNGTLVSTQSNNSYTIAPEEYGIYSVKVKAIANEANYSTSEYSNEVSYSYQKKSVPTPIVEVDGETVTWFTSSRADHYEVYVNEVFVENNTTGLYKAPSEPGSYKIQVRGISKDETLYNSSVLSSVATVKVSKPVDLSKDIIVYSKNLVLRLERYVLGIMSQNNKYLTSNPAYLERLDYMDNYLCNLVQYKNVSDITQYAWRLEEVEYSNEFVWVNSASKVYRIRLTDGTYLTASKNNLISAGGDYISSSEYVKDDIWQYWQFIPIEGYKNEYYISNVGSTYDWNISQFYLTDTSRADGGAELYTMTKENEYYFHFVVENVEGATFAEVKNSDKSGKYVVTNFKNGNVYSIGSLDNLVKTDRTVTNALDTDIWELERVSGEDSYLIKFADGSYLCMVNYELHKTSNKVDAHKFYLLEVSGVKDCYKLCGAEKTDFCKFIDTGDNTTRLYCYSDTEVDGVVTRWWNGIADRNCLGNYWIFTKTN